MCNSMDIVFHISWEHWKTAYLTSLLWQMFWFIISQFEMVQIWCNRHIWGLNIWIRSSKASESAVDMTLLPLGKQPAPDSHSCLCVYVSGRRGWTAEGCGWRVCQPGSACSLSPVMCKSGGGVAEGQLQNGRSPVQPGWGAADWTTCLHCRPPDIIQPTDIAARWQTQPCPPHGQTTAIISVMALSTVAHALAG